MDDPDSNYYLPDDYVFHGAGAVEDYIVDSYFAESKRNLFGTVCAAHHLAWHAGPLPVCASIQAQSCVSLGTIGPFPLNSWPRDVKPASAKCSSSPMVGVLFAARPVAAHMQPFVTLGR